MVPYLVMLSENGLHSVPNRSLLANYGKCSILAANRPDWPDGKAWLIMNTLRLSIPVGG